MKSWPKVKLGYYLLQFGLIYPYLAPKYHLSIFSLTYLYLPLFTYIWLYLGLIALILPYVPYSPKNMYYAETAPLCKILEQSDHYSWR